MIGFSRRPEAGHSDGDDFLFVFAKKFKGAGRHEKRQRRIQPARNPHDRRFRGRMSEAFGQRMRLHGENELGPFAERSAFRRHERQTRHFTQREFACARKRTFGYGIAVGGCRRNEASQPSPFRCKKRNVYFRLGFRSRKRLCFGEQRTVFKNEVMPGKDHIRRGFAHSRIRIHIGAYVFSRVRPEQRLSVFRLTHCFVRSGKVDHDRRARSGMTDGRRNAGPKILAYLAGDFRFG